MYRIYFFLVFIFFSCKDAVLPKPKAFLRLKYPKPLYEKVDANATFLFEKNNLATRIKTTKIPHNKTDFGVTLEYPKIKATIFITYKRITKRNFKKLLKDTEKFTLKHTAKANQITEQKYTDSIRKVYGMLYEVDGNAASQSQFYVTDSLNHFVYGSLYFYAKPNFDSILPAANYLHRDVKHIMETITWK